MENFHSRCLSLSVGQGPFVSPGPTLPLIVGNFKSTGRNFHFCNHGCFIIYLLGIGSISGTRRKERMDALGSWGISRHSSFLESLYGSSLFRKDREYFQWPVVWLIHQSQHLIWKLPFLPALTMHDMFSTRSQNGTAHRIVNLFRIDSLSFHLPFLFLF